MRTRKEISNIDITKYMKVHDNAQESQMYILQGGKEADHV